MLPRFLGEDGRARINWEEMGQGAPTLIGLARICSDALISPTRNPESLSVEAKLVLFLAKSRGVIHVMGNNDEFDPADRFLTVHVEVTPDKMVSLKFREEPKQTIRFLEGFKELCEAGLVIHHLYREFSLSLKGFDLAEKVALEEVQSLMKYTERDLKD